jgi:Dolichyl-phosphate-mannose-protein mannosyltransferase
MQFHPFVQWDGAYYINYFRDSDWQSVFHPGYSIFIELARLVIPDGVRAAQLVSVVAGSLLPIPLYILARHFLKPSLSLLAVLVVVCNPLIVRFGVMTMTESLFILVEVSLFAAFLKNKPIFFGLLGGLGYLIRPEGIIPVVILISYSLFKHKVRTPLLLMIGCFIIITAPYIVYLRIQTGNWTLSAKTMNLRVWERDWRINVSHEATDSPSYSLRERIDSGLKNYPARILEYGRKIIKYAGIPILLLGLIGMIKHRNVLIAAMPMLLLLPIFGLDPSERFLIPYLPFLVLFAFLLLASWENHILKYAVVLLLIVGYLPTAAYAITPEEGITEFCKAGMDMKFITNSSDIFVDRKPFTAFYAGGKYLPMPNDPVDSILAFCRKNNARFLVVSARVVRVFRPQLNFLLYSDTVLNRLNLKTAYVRDLDSGYGIRIIEVSK